MELGLLRNRSRKRGEAIVVIRKHPDAMVSRMGQLLSMIRRSQAARTAKGIGVASKRSNGIRIRVEKILHC